MLVGVFLRSSLLAFNSDIIAHSGYIKRIRASLLVFDIMVTFVLLESILRLESFCRTCGLGHPKIESLFKSKFSCNAVAYKSDA